MIDTVTAISCWQNPASAGFYYYDPFAVVNASGAPMAKLIADEIRDGKIPPELHRRGVAENAIAKIITENFISLPKV